MQTDQDKIKVVIVDDEPQSILRLENDLATLEDFEVIATSSSAMSAKTLVMSMQPDVLFIDVEMPGQTGFEVLQSLRDEMPMDLIVVFYSAFNKYMIDALRASAFDFLLKPYQQEELELVVGRIRQKMEGGDGSSSSSFSSSSSSSSSSESHQDPQNLLGVNGLLGTSGKRLAIQSISGLLMVKPDEVFCCTFDEDTRLWHLRLANGQVSQVEEADHGEVCSLPVSIAGSGPSGLHHQSRLPHQYRELHPSLHLLSSLRPGEHHRFPPLLQGGEGEAGDTVGI